MVTLCWAAKGGSGTTTVVAALALESTAPSLVVDLSGEVPAVLGATEPDRPGVTDWLAASGAASQLDDLLIEIDDTTTLLPAHRWSSSPPPRPAASIVDVAADRDVDPADTAPDSGALTPSSALDLAAALDRSGLTGAAEATIHRPHRHDGHEPNTAMTASVPGVVAADHAPRRSTAEPPPAVIPLAASAAPGDRRWHDLVAWMHAWEARHRGVVWIDAGTGTPSSALASVVERRWLVTRACYLSLTRAARADVHPTGVVMIVEPGRQLRTVDIERSTGAPVVAQIDFDLGVARSVDCGLLASRPPRSLRRSLRRISA